MSKPAFCLFSAALAFQVLLPGILAAQSMLQPQESSRRSAAGVAAGMAAGMAAGLPPEAVSAGLQAPETEPVQLLLRNGAGSDSPPLAMIRARLTPHSDFESAVVQIEVSLSEGCHLYSLTQADARRTRIDVSLPGSLQVAGPVQPSHAPESVTEVAGEAPSETYSSRVVFFVPVKIVDRKLFGREHSRVRVNGMICSASGFCLPVRDGVVKAVVTDPVEILPGLPLAGTAAAETADSTAGSGNPIR